MVKLKTFDDGILYGVISWENGNLKLDGMPYFTTKEQALRYIGEKLGFDELTDSDIEIRYTIIQLKRGLQE